MYTYSRCAYIWDVIMFEFQKSTIRVYFYSIIHTYIYYDIHANLIDHFGRTSWVAMYVRQQIQQNKTSKTINRACLAKRLLTVTQWNTKTKFLLTVSDSNSVFFWKVSESYSTANDMKVATLFIEYSYKETHIYKYY